MIVIASVGERFIYENLKYINKFNNKEKICIVDNINEGNKYFSKLKSMYPNLNIDVINSDKNLREWGSWWAAYKKYPNESHYCFIHDSMYLKQDIKKYIPRQNQVYAFAIRRGWVNPAYKKSPFILKTSKMFDYKIEQGNDFYLIYGCMFIIDKQTINKIQNIGLMNVYAQDRNDACSSERALGHIFKKLGIKVNFYTDKTPSGKNNKGLNNLSNPVKTENDLYIKIRTGRNYKW